MYYTMKGKKMQGKKFCGVFCNIATILMENSGRETGASLHPHRSIFGESFSTWDHNNRLGAAIVVSVTGAQIAAAGAAAAIGLGILFAQLPMNSGPLNGTLSNDSSVCFI